MTEEKNLDTIRDDDIRQLWRANNEVMKVVTRLEAEFNSFLTTYQASATQNRPPSILSVIVAFVSLLVPFCVFFWMFVEVRVSPIEQVILLIREQDSRLLAEVGGVEKEMGSISRQQGAVQKDLEWLKILAFQLKDDRDATRLEFTRLAEKIGGLNARQEWMRKWVEDVDKGGSRRWIDAEPRRYGEGEGEAR